MNRLLVALLCVIPSSQAAASTFINFDTCSEPSLCGQLQFRAGEEGFSFFRFVLGSDTLELRSYGLNFVDPELSTYRIAVAGAPLQHPVPTGPGTIGAYGEFPFIVNGNFWADFTSYRSDVQIFAPEFERLYIYQLFWPPNERGFFAAAEVFNRQTGVSGFVAARLDPPAPVPEPATLTLFGIGLAATAWRRRRN